MAGNKRMLGIFIIDILSSYASKKKPMTQSEIIDKLDKKYQARCTRSTLATHIGIFQSLEFQNTFGCTVKCDKRGAGYYLERDISDGELGLLIDSVMSIRSLSKADTKKLIEKLIAIGSEYFKKRANNYTKADMKEKMPHLHSHNEETLNNMAVINEAMIDGKKISFIYNQIVLGSKKEILLEPKSTERYLVNPYRMTLYGGRLYLICNTEPYENISTYRVDKMTGVMEETASIKPWRDIDKGYNPPRTMVESLHMFSSDSTDIEFWIEDHCLKDVVDWFGWDNFEIWSQKNKKLLIRVKCSETAMQFWALSYGEYIEIIKPKRLRDKIRNVAQEIHKNHQ